MKSKREVIKEINSLGVSDARKAIEELKKDRGLKFATEVLWKLDIYKYGRWWINEADWK